LPDELKKWVRTHWRWLVFGLSIALTVVTLYFVFRKIDQHAFAHLFWMQDRGLLVGAAAFILLQINLGAERWRTILSAMTRGHTPSVMSVQAVFYSSIFFNCLPLGTISGDVARVWLARKLALSLKQLVLSVLIDRMLVVGVLIVLALVSLPSIAQPLATTIWLGCAAALVAGVAVFLLLQPIARMLGRWSKMRPVYFLLRAAEELRSATQRGSLRASVWALLSAICGNLAAYCIARGLGFDVGLIAIIAVMSIVIIVSALPISLAGWGVREFSTVVLLGLLGIEREAALLFSVEFGLIGMLMSLPGGAIWFASRRNRTTPASVVQSEPVPEGSMAGR
jgi:glycosyltransferase 2 family protein